ncbi:hypothetical protein C7S14_7446 [Burkholderia cepacia]|nr:hypothetical protein C7S14_7446 [Burkholderia cepacia]
MLWITNRGSSTPCMSKRFDPENSRCPVKTVLFGAIRP